MTSFRRASLWLEANRFDVLCLLVCLVAYVRAVDPSRLLLGWDIDGAALDAPLALQRALLSWAYNQVLGANNAQSLALIPTYFGEAALERLRVPVSAVQYFVVGVYLLLIPIGMNLYARYVFPSRTTLRCIATLASFFSLYLAVANHIAPYAHFNAAIAAGPLLASAWLRCSRAFNLKTVLLLLASNLAVCVVGANLAGAVVGFACAFCFAVIGAGLMRIEYWRVAAPIAASIALNAFWLVPNVQYFLADADQIVASEYAKQWGDYALWATSESATFENLIRLVGVWDWTHADRDQHVYIAFAAPFQQKPWLFALSFLSPALVIAAVVTRRREASAFFIFLLAALFFMKGTAPPFGGIYDWLYHHAPGFNVFRNPFSKFGIAAAPAMAILVGLGVEGLTSRLRPPAKEIGVAAAAIAIATIIFPFWTGQVFKRNAYLPTYYVNLPASYSQAAQYLNTEPDQSGRVLVLPFSWALSYTALKWGFIGPDPLRFMIARPSVYEARGFTDPYVGIVFENAGTIREVLRRAVDRASVRYVLIHNDVFEHRYYGADSAADAAAIVNSLGARFVGRFGEDLDLYEMGRPGKNRGFGVFSFDRSAAELRGVGAGVAYAGTARTVWARPEDARSAAGEEKAAVVALPATVSGSFDGILPPGAAPSDAGILEGQFLEPRVAFDLRPGTYSAAFVGKREYRPGRWKTKRGPVPPGSAAYSVPVKIAAGDVAYGLQYQAAVPNGFALARLVCCGGRIEPPDRSRSLILDGRPRIVAFRIKAARAGAGRVEILERSAPVLASRPPVVVVAPVLGEYSLRLRETIRRSGSAVPGALRQVLEREYEADTNVQEPSVTFTSPGVDSATVRVSEPGLLWLRMAYNRGWVATQDGRSLEHVVVDGIFNGWLVSRPGEISVRFAPSDVRSASAFVSVGVIPILLIAARRRHRRPAA